MINDFVCTVIREEKNNLLNVINKSVTILDSPLMWLFNQMDCSLHMHYAIIKLCLGRNDAFSFLL